MRRWMLNLNTPRLRRDKVMWNSKHNLPNYHRKEMRTCDLSLMLMHYEFGLWLLIMLSKYADQHIFLWWEGLKKICVDDHMHWHTLKLVGISRSSCMRIHRPIWLTMEQWGTVGVNCTLRVILPKTLRRKYHKTYTNATTMAYKSQYPM